MQLENICSYSNRMVDTGFFSMQIPTFRWIILVKTPFLIVSLSAHVSTFICSEFSGSRITSVNFPRFKSTVENQVLSSQVMWQLPSTRHLGGIKPATGSTPKSKCFISAIAHPLLVLGQWATSFFLKEWQDPEIYFAFIHLLEEIHMDVDAFCSNVCCLYPHFSHNLFLYVFVDVVNTPLVQVCPLSLAACISIVLP